MISAARLAYIVVIYSITSIVVKLLANSKWYTYRITVEFGQEIIFSQVFIYHECLRQSMVVFLLSH